MAESPEQIIRRIAIELGVDVNLALAMAQQESGLNPRAVGDNGHSVGLYQLHDQGMGAGMGDSRYDPEVNARRALSYLAEYIRSHPNMSPGEQAAGSQRPQDPRGYAASIDAKLRNTSSQSSAPQQQSQGGSYTFPIVGYKGSVSAHWGNQDPRARGGADLMAPEGSQIVSMSPGKVQWADYNAVGGNNVGILGDDGLTYYYAHMREAPAVKAGDRVNTGTTLGYVGKSGNASGGPPHLHIGIGRTISQGADAFGGLGTDYDATSLLMQTLQGGAPAAAAQGAQGGRAVATDPRITNAQAAVRDATANRATLSAQVEAAKYNARILRPPTAKPGTVAGEAWEKSSQDRIDAAQKAYDQNEQNIQKLNADIAAWQQEAAKAAAEGPKGTVREQGDKVWFFPSDGGPAQDVTPQGWQPDTSKIQTVTAGGKVYERDANGKWNVVIDATSPTDTAKDKIALEIAQIQLKKAQLDYDQASSPEAKELAQVQLTLAKANLAKAQRGETINVNGRPYVLSDDGKTATPIQGIGPPVQTVNIPGQGVFYSTDEGRTFQASTGLPSPQPQEVSAPPTQQYILRRRPDGSIEQIENPNFQPPQLQDPGAQYSQERERLQGLATKERDRLLELQHNGTITAEDAQKQFNDFFQSKVLTPLSGFRAQAERQRYQDELAQQAAQRQENQRAEAINRERERYAYESGQQFAQKAGQIIPETRSPAFLGNVANLANNWMRGDFKGTGVTFTPESFQLPPSQIPNLQQIAAQQTAQALAHISPAAAAQIGAPLPPVAGLPNISQFMPQFQLPQAQQQQLPQLPIPQPPPY